MPLFEVQDQDGTTLTLEGDSPPTESELEEIFSTHNRQQGLNAVTQAANLADKAIGMTQVAAQAGGVPAAQAYIPDYDAEVPPDIQPLINENRTALMRNTMSATAGGPQLRATGPAAWETLKGEISEGARAPLYDVTQLLPKVGPKELARASSEFGMGIGLPYPEPSQEQLARAESSKPMQLAAGLTAGTGELIAGIANYFQSGQGMIELGVTKTPAAPAVLLKWAKDMVEGGMINAGEAYDAYKRGDMQEFGRHVASGLGMLAGSWMATQHGVRRTRPFIKPTIQAVQELLPGGKMLKAERLATEEWMRQSSDLNDAIATLEADPNLAADPAKQSRLNNLRLAQKQIGLSDAHQKIIDEQAKDSPLPVEVVWGKKHKPGQYAGVRLGPDGTPEAIEFYGEDVPQYVENIARRKRGSAIGRTIGEEYIHGFTDPKDADLAAASADPIERWVTQKVYGRKVGEDGMTERDLGYEIIRRRIEKMSGDTRESVEASFEDRLDINALDLMARVVAGIRQRLGTTRNVVGGARLRGAVDRTLANIEAARAATDPDWSVGDEGGPAAVNKPKKSYDEWLTELKQLHAASEKELIDGIAKNPPKSSFDLFAPDPYTTTPAYKAVVNHVESYPEYARIYQQGHVGQPETGPGIGPAAIRKEDLRLGRIPDWASPSLRSKLERADKAGAASKIDIHDEWQKLSPQQRQELAKDGWTTAANRANRVTIGLHTDVGPDRLRAKLMGPAALRRRPDQTQDMFPTGDVEAASRFAKMRAALSDPRVVAKADKELRERALRGERLPGDEEVGPAAVRKSKEELIKEADVFVANEQREMEKWQTQVDLADLRGDEAKKIYAMRRVEAAKAGRDFAQKLRDSLGDIGSDSFPAAINKSQADFQRDAERFRAANNLPATFADTLAKHLAGGPITDDVAKFLSEHPEYGKFGEGPAALNKRQQRAAEEWGGKGLVRDKLGAPLLMFHGSPVEGLKEIRPPIFLTPKRSLARMYRAEKEGAWSGRVYPAYVKMEKPFTWTEGRGVPVEEARRILDRGYDGIVNMEPGGEEYIVASQSQLMPVTEPSGEWGSPAAIRVNRVRLHEEPRRTYREWLDEESRVWAEIDAIETDKRKERYPTELDDLWDRRYDLAEGYPEYEKIRKSSGDSSRDVGPGLGPAALNKRQQKYAEDRAKLLALRQAAEAGKEPPKMQSPVSQIPMKERGPGDTISATEAGALPRITPDQFMAGEITPRPLRKRRTEKQQQKPPRVSYTHPSFRDFRKVYPSASREQLVQLWHEAVDKAIDTASDDRLGEWLKALGMTKAYGATVRTRTAGPEYTGELKQAEMETGKSGFGYRMEGAKRLREKADQLEKLGGKAQVIRNLRERADRIAAGRPETGLPSRRIDKVRNAIKERLKEEAQQGPDLDRREIFVDDVDYDNGGYEELSKSDIEHQGVLNILLRRKARGSSSDPETATRRLVAVVGDDGKVHLLSTYNDNGIQRVVDPAGGMVGKPHRPLDASFLKRYRPFATILLKDPVQAFHQRFGSVSEFMDLIGEEALGFTKEGGFVDTRTAPPGEHEIEGTEGIRGEGGGFMGPSSRVVRAQAALGQPERLVEGPLEVEDVEAIHKHVTEEIGSNRWEGPEDVASSIEAIVWRAKNKKMRSVDWNAIQGYVKLFDAIQKLHPDIPDDRLIDQLVRTIYENQSTSATIEQFIGRTLAQHTTRGAKVVLPLPEGATPAPTGRELSIPATRRPIAGAGGPYGRSIARQAAEIARREAEAAKTKEGPAKLTPEEEQYIQTRPWNPAEREIRGQRPAKWTGPQGAPEGSPFEKTLLALSKSAREAESEAAAEGPAAIIKKAQAAAEDKFIELKDVVSAKLKRREAEQDIVAWRDSADNIAHTQARNAGNAVRVNSNIPLVRAAAKAVIAAGGDQSQLVSFLRSIDTGIAGANALVASRNMVDRRVGRAWLKAAQKLRQEVEYAQSHWNNPELRATAKAGAIEMSDEFHLERNNGINLRSAPNYIPGRYDAEFFNDNAIMFGGQRILGRNYRKPKAFANYYEAIAAGPYIPKSYDLADLVEHRVRQGRTEVNKRLWLDSLKQINDPDSGDPVVVNARWRPDIDANGNPLQSGAWVSPSPEHELFSLGPGQEPVAVRQGYKDLLDVLTMQSTMSKTPLGKFAINSSALLKHGAILILDTFHVGRLGQYGVSLHGLDTGFKGGFSALEYRDADLPKAVARGLITQEQADWASKMVTVKLANGRPGTLTRRQVLDGLMANGLNIGRIQDAIYKDMVRNWPVIGRLNRWTFDKFTRGLMAEGAVREFERLNKDVPNQDYQRLARRIANDMNIYYGSIGRQGWIRNPTIRDLSQIIFLAPQWVEGLIQKDVKFASRSAAAPFRLMAGKTAGMGTIGRGVGRGLLGYFLLTQIINLITRRQTTFQNEEEGHKLDAWIPTGEGTGFWASPMAVFGEVMHDIVRLSESKPNTYEAIRQVGENKLGPWGRVAIILSTRENPQGQRLTSTASALGSAAAQLAPAPISLGIPIRAASHAIAPSLVSPPPQGALTRQLLASAGVKVQPGATAIRQIRDLADSYMKAEEAKPEDMEVSVETDNPSYVKLRSALANNDKKGAAMIYKQIKAGGRDDEHIAKAMALWYKRPFTGSQTYEPYFKAQLSSGGLEVYDRAQAERYEILSKFQELAADMHD